MRTHLIVDKGSHGVVIFTLPFKYSSNINDYNGVNWLKRRQLMKEYEREHEESAQTAER